MDHYKEDVGFATLYPSSFGSSADEQSGQGGADAGKTTADPEPEPEAEPEKVEVTER